MQASDRLGGHIVQGHVDGVGDGRLDRREDGFARRLRVALPPELLRYAVDKGSITLSGVSLTVAELRRRLGRGLADPGDPGADEPRRARRRETQLERRVRHRGQVRGAVAGTIRRKGASVSQMTETAETRRVATRRGRAPFSTIEEAIEEIRRGRMVVVCDGEDRENEGDLVMAAQFATPEAVNFMAKEARGLICLALTAERCERLGLNLMAAKNEAPLQTAFTVTIEAAGGVSTGISAHDRAHTIQVAIDPDSGPRDIVVPGHMFPLRAKDGGVLERTGHTEASVDLARLAGLTPAGVICEVMNDDGTMARVPDLVPYCEKHGLKMITVADLIAYRRRTEKLVERVVATGAADLLRRLHRGRLPLAGRRQTPRGDGQGRRRRGRGRARPRPQRVPHRRRLPQHALRLRRAAGGGAGDDRGARAAASSSTSPRRGAGSAC